MANFDVSKEWAILVPPDVPSAKKGAEDISRCIALLRKGAGLGSSLPPLLDASGNAPPETIPIIVLNAENSGPERNGFTWRAGNSRVEIFGESPRGLCNGIYDFLAALGIRWPAPGKEIFPAIPEGKSAEYQLEPSGVYKPSKYEKDEIEKVPWRRYVFSSGDGVLKSGKKQEALAAWAARNKYDVLVFPFELIYRRNAALLKLADQYALINEAGGRELSVLVPRRLFFFHRELFRMEEGKRQKRIHFCPTNPDSLKIIRTEGKKLFGAAEGIKIFHLWPDKGDTPLWCTCPTCRAFTPAEQYRIAVNAAADVLAEIRPDAKMSFYEKAGEGGGIPLRPNLFRLEEQQSTTSPQSE